MTEDPDQLGLLYLNCEGLSSDEFLKNKKIRIRLLVDIFFCCRVSLMT